MTQNFSLNFHAHEQLRVTTISARCDEVLQTALSLQEEEESSITRKFLCLLYPLKHFFFPIMLYEVKNHISGFSSKTVSSYYSPIPKSFTAEKYQIFICSYGKGLKVGLHDLTGLFLPN